MLPKHEEKILFEKEFQSKVFLFLFVLWKLELLLQIRLFHASHFN